MHLVSSMAYVADTPWHGLGSYPAPQAPVWAALQIISITYHFVEAITVWPKSQPYDVVQRHSLWRYVVTIPCPKCNSPQTEALDRATKIGGAAGAIAGAAGGAAMTLASAETGAAIGMLAGPVGAALGGLTGAIIGALIGGTTGCAAGVALGETVDTHVLDNYRCLDCKHTFGRTKASA